MKMKVKKISKDYQLIEEFLNDTIGINEYGGIFPKGFDLEIDEDYNEPGYYVAKINVMDKKEVEIFLHVKDDEVCVVNSDVDTEACGICEAPKQLIVDIIYQLA